MDIIAFLEKLPIFSDLDESDLSAIANISEIYEFEAHAVIAYQRDVAEHLYLIHSGRVVEQTVNQNGMSLSQKLYKPNECFGEIWLFTPKPHTATIRAATSGKLVMIPSNKFLALIKRRKNLLLNLNFSPETNELIDNSSFAKTKEPPPASKLLSDEIIEYSGRRTHWLLLLKLIPPAFAFVVVPLIFYSVFRSYPGLLDNILYISLFLLLPLFIIILWAVYNWYDWHADNFIITNKHLVHTEFSLNLRKFGTRINKIPIDQIQSVEIEKPSIFATILNVGTARITTSAQASVIYFDFIHNPIQVKDTLNRLAKYVKSLDAGREQQQLRQSIESHFTPVVGAIKKAAAPEEPFAQSVGFWQSIKDMISYRNEDGSIISYRKHLFALFSDINWPFGVAILLSLILYFTWQSPSNQLRLLILGLFIMDIIWLIWRIEDWRNDTFQVTDRYVIDIDRQPFGFGESRKQAELGNVQNVNVNQIGLLRSIFNYGDVVIETAGATSDMVFEQVSHPNEVQSDIFRRRDQYKKKQKANQEVGRRQEYAVLLDVYHQAVEQGRIPRRTPPPEEESFVDSGEL